MVSFDQQYLKFASEILANIFKNPKIRNLKNFQLKKKETVGRNPTNFYYLTFHINLNHMFRFFYTNVKLINQSNMDCTHHARFPFIPTKSYQFTT